MSGTVADVQQMLALRLGESAAPSDSTTKAQRLNWINAGYMNMSRRRNWWWQEATDSSNINNGSTNGYIEPTNCKKIIELQINNIYYTEIPYIDNRIYKNTIGVVNLPYLGQAYKFYRYGGSYFPIPVPGSDSIAHYIKFYIRVTNRTSDSDTFLFPDEYLEALAAFAEARYWMSITQQTKASVPFQEYEEIITEMSREQGRRTTGSPGFATHEPEDTIRSR